MQLPIFRDVENLSKVEIIINLNKGTVLSSWITYIKINDITFLVHFASMHTIDNTRYFHLYGFDLCHIYLVVAVKLGNNCF